jgi:hypothetical protein
MGKHNGKARTSGAKVGSVLVNKARKVPMCNCPKGAASALQM